MRKRLPLTIALVFFGAAVLLGARGAAAARTPPLAPAGSTTRPAAAEVPAAEFRFDALRFDGRLTGPRALVTYARRAASRAPLHSLRVDFSARIFETVEAEALH